MVLDASLLNTQHYKVRIKGKVEQSREGVAPPLHLGVVAIEKGAFGLPSTMVANFTYLKVGLRISDVSEYQNLPQQLLENEEHNSNTCCRGNVSWFNKQYKTIHDELTRKHSFHE